MSSEQLRKHALEVMGSVWLILVAIQYLSSYFIGPDVDFSFAYIVMLAITVLAAIVGRGEASAAE